MFHFSLKEAKGGNLNEFLWKSIPKFGARAYYLKQHEFCTSRITPIVAGIPCIVFVYGYTLTKVVIEIQQPSPSFPHVIHTRKKIQRQSGVLGLGGLGRERL